MKIRLNFYALLLGLGAAFTGCDGAVDAVYKEQLVVRSFIIEGRGIDSVVVNRTTPFGEFLSDSVSAINGAEVSVTVDGVRHLLLAGTINGPKRGRYYLPRSELTIEGGKTYTLEVNYKEHHLTSSTIVPMPIHFIDLDHTIPPDHILTLDTTNYSAFSFVFKAAPQDNPNRKYFLRVEALDTTQGRISIPFAGPPVDTTRYTHYSFMQLAPSIPLSPRLFGWFGPNRISIMAIDTNFVDYRRQTFGRVATYQPSLNHVNGGLGVFGSAAIDTVTVFLKLGK